MLVKRVEARHLKPGDVLQTGALVLRNERGRDVSERVITLEVDGEFRERVLHHLDRETVVRR